MSASEHDALEAELARALRARTTPPASVVDAAMQLYTWRTVDAELAELAYDSVLDEGAAGVRAASQPRILTFEAGPLTIEVEVDAGSWGRRLLGQLVPPQAAELELHADGPPVAVSADAQGRFVVPLPAAPSRVHLRVRTDDGAVVRTAATVV